MEVFLLKNSDVLLLLTFCPKAISYIFKISNTFPHSSIVGLQKSRLSFARSKWVSLGPLLQRENPCISPLHSAFLINSFNPSVQSKNRKGDNRPPYLIPRVSWIMPHGSPFTRIEYVTILTHPIIKCIHPSLNPNFLISCSRISNPPDHRPYSYLILKPKTHE